MNQEIVNFISQAQASGMTNDQIRQDLIAAGWAEAAVMQHLMNTGQAPEILTMASAAPAATPLAAPTASAPDGMQEHRALDRQHLDMDKKHAATDDAHIAADAEHAVLDKKHRKYDYAIVAGTVVSVAVAGASLLFYLQSQPRIKEVESKFSESQARLETAGTKLSETELKLQNVGVKLDATQKQLADVELKFNNTKAAEEIFSETRPAVVRIGMKVQGTVAYPEIKVRETLGEIELYPGPNRESASVTGVRVGTGFVVNLQGYIATNAHVVDVSKATLEANIREIYAVKISQLLLAALPQSDEATLIKVRKLFTNYMDKYGTVSDIVSKTSVFNPSQKSGTLGDYIDNGFAVGKAKKMGNPWPERGMDLAIIKPAGFVSAAVLPLADSNAVRQGSRVYVFGYPVIADLNDSGNIEPTITEGVVSAIKKSSEGDYNVIQIDAAINGGSSGGPAVDNKGFAVGIATFAAHNVTGYGWILPIDLVKVYLTELKVPF